ncbi:MAG TPA: response regulator [Dehalococcoidia bacterium]|nr:response regulator [Dehalococcoidia bacterium]
MKRRPYIMAVDDEQEILTLLKRSLEPEGYEVALACDGRSALALMEKRQPDLIILDIMMPDLNGFQVLSLIRQRSSAPVIMLTGKGEVTTLRDALLLGADDFVRKPFYIKELLARVKAKLRRAGFPEANSQE